MTPPKAREKRSIAIIGAGFGGLALAKLLVDNRTIKCDVFEARSANDDLSYYNGEIRLPCLDQKYVQDRLRLQQPTNIKLGESLTVSRAEILKEIRQGVPNIHYQCPITTVIKGSDSQYWLTDAQNKQHGPFHKIIVADGVRSPFRKVPFVCCIGDARWVQDVFYDFGFTRIQRGADIAIKDAVALEQILSEGDWETPLLNRFQASNRRYLYFLVLLMVLMMAIVVQKRLQQ